MQVHERHLNTDILLALMRALLLQRPDLRVILMSATINVNAYSDYFGAAPIIQVTFLRTSFPWNAFASIAEAAPGCSICNAHSNEAGSSKDYSSLALTPACLVDNVHLIPAMSDIDADSVLTLRSYIGYVCGVFRCQGGYIL